MPAVIPAIVAPSATDPLFTGTVERRDVGPSDVRIDIRWAGVCHSDIHTVQGDWGPQPYPLTVGHEIVGTVAEIGSDVTGFAVGDRVGVGCLVNSCGECANCAAGQEQYCENGAIGTYAATDVDGTVTQGGYSTSVVVTEKFVLRVPEAIPYEKAAPLLCAGITTYSPLRHWNAGPGKKVAVIGLGGLGHMAVKIAHAMGAEVTVLSRSEAKRDDALKLGADHYFATEDDETFRTLRASFDLIINSVSAAIDINAYLKLLALDGTLVNVGAPSEPMPVGAGTLISNRRSFAGSNIGGIAETQEMLDFCAEHDIAPEVEITSADDINEAWARVLASDVRYRFVIDIDTLR
ncbi:putative zinc-type alcohol dehydrogenase-like protein [Microbacterium ginsengiterrae]|uniref:alcohol dehydrogenase (NADP(+)) n=1 Tax=Microbacterium ginsengiterrae TaxID=546115 RepID=A0A7W9CBS1_9MICO|nr:MULTISPECIES: NAD(P)-dependent alcohol dehydrogenase [Microbacterium]MBB5742670.1 putative zinc-type alcohol dehydrogenase-like protein [Microbacterium ginsengiterrae]